MEEDIDKKQEILTEVETQEKLGIGVKIALTVGVLGAVAVGIFVAILLS